MSSCEFEPSNLLVLSARESLHCQDLWDAEEVIAVEDHTYVVVEGRRSGWLERSAGSGPRWHRVAVVDVGAPRNAPAAHMQGFLSRDGMPPADLLAEGRHEVSDPYCGMMRSSPLGVGGVSAFDDPRDSPVGHKPDHCYSYVDRNGCPRLEKRDDDRSHVCNSREPALAVAPNRHSQS